MQSADIKKTIDYARRNGLAAAYAAARERLEDRRSPYVYEVPSEAELEEQREQTAVWTRAGQAPFISVVVPAWETPQGYYDAMAASVRAQSYDRYELIVSREPGGISANTNAGIGRAAGEYIALLDHDDVLAPDALFRMAEAVIRARENGIRPLLVYSDEDKLREEDGRTLYFAPNRKPDFNYDHLLSNNYICHLTMIEAGLMKRLQMRSAYDGAQDHDLFLRVCGEAMREEEDPLRADARFLHVPRVLYHWRSHEASTAESGANKAYAHDAGKRAVEAHLRERGIPCAVEELAHRGFLRVHYFEDIFASRPDLGAIGGKLVDRRGRMVGGLYTAAGEILFDGLKRGWSGGYTHRAACQQDAEAVDLTNIRIRPELLSEIPAELKPWIHARAEDFSDRVNRVEKSIAVCNAIRAQGYRILWDPLLEEKGRR